MYPEQNPTSPQAGGLPTPQVYGQSSDPSGGGKKKLFLMIGGGVVLIIIVVVAIVLVGGSGKNPKKNPVTDNTTQSEGPAPATTLSVQQNADSINQALSTLNDISDFPAKALSDDSLSGN